MKKEKPTARQKARCQIYQQYFAITASPLKELMIKVYSIQWPRNEVLEEQSGGIGRNRTMSHVIFGRSSPLVAAKESASEQWDPQRKHLRDGTDSHAMPRVGVGGRGGEPEELDQEFDSGI